MIVAALVAILAPTHADHVRDVWQNRYERLCKAIDASNLADYEASLAPDFVLVDSSGRMRKDRYLVGVRQLFGQATGSKDRVVVISVRQGPKSAVVDYSWQYQVLTQSHGGATMTSAYQTGYDIWELVGGKWLTTKTVVKTFRRKVSDG